MTEYAVKMRTSEGWKIIHWDDNPGHADKWLMEFVKKNGYIISDFTIKAIEQ